MNTRAEARVIASFTFIVALLFGAWGALDQLIAGPPPLLLPEPEPGRFAIALMPFAATAVAFQAANTAEAAWARTLGGAAVILGVLPALAVCSTSSRAGDADARGRRKAPVLFSEADQTGGHTAPSSRSTRSTSAGRHRCTTT